MSKSSTQAVEQDINVLYAEIFDGSTEEHPSKPSFSIWWASRSQEFGWFEVCMQQFYPSTSILYGVYSSSIDWRGAFNWNHIKNMRAVLGAGGMASHFFTNAANVITFAIMVFVLQSDFFDFREQIQPEMGLSFPSLAP